MGLNESYKHVRNHFQALDPLPSIGKAYYLVSQVEKQKEVSGISIVNEESSAFTIHKQ